VWKANKTTFTGTYFYVRTTDLATVEIDLPYIYNQIAPVFQFFGAFSGTTFIRFTNIVVGTPSSSNFQKPAYPCNHVPPSLQDKPNFANPSKYFDILLETILQRATKLISAIGEKHSHQHKLIGNVKKEMMKKRCHEKR